MTTDLGVFFPCDEKAAEYAIALANTINSTNVVKTSLSFGYLPHISIFQGKFLNTNIDKFIDITNSLFSTISSFPIKLDSKLEMRLNGNVFWHIEKSDTLQGVHELALQHLQPLTKGLLMNQMQKLLEKNNISQNQKFHIENFGSLLSGENFTPHITICHLEDMSKGAKSINKIATPPHSWTIFEYQIGELRADGSVSKVLFTGKLKT